MTVRSILLASLFAAVAVPAVAQDYQYGSGYGSDYDQRRDSVYASDRREIRSVIEFEIPLARYGRWVASRYGRAWSPRVGRDWRPYTVGRWVDTEDGRVWDSSEPWGWATYHYGRWGFDDRYGWVWVPGLEWAPAWVAFRDGDDYAGWAPLPPQVGYDYDVDAWDYQRWYEPSWVYVPRASFYSGRIGGAILPWRSNRNYWDRTRQRQFDGRPGSGRPDRDGRPGYGNRPGGDNRPGNDGRPGRPGYGNRPDGDNRPGNDGRPGRPGNDGHPGYGQQPGSNPGIVPPASGRPGRPQDSNAGRPDRDGPRGDGTWPRPGNDRPGGDRPPRDVGTQPDRPVRVLRPAPDTTPPVALGRPDRPEAGRGQPGGYGGGRGGQQGGVRAGGGNPSTGGEIGKSPPPRQAAPRPAPAPAAAPAPEAKPERSQRPDGPRRGERDKSKPE